MELSKILDLTEKITVDSSKYVPMMIVKWEDKS